MDRNIRIKEYERNRMIEDRTDKFLRVMKAVIDRLIYLVIAFGVIGGGTYLSENISNGSTVMNIWLVLMWWYVIANKFNDYKRR